MPSPLLPPKSLPILLLLSILGSTSPAGAAVASDAELRDAVAAADRALAQAVAEDDEAAFRALLADDALLLGATASRGPDAAVAAWRPLLTPGGPELTWEPREVVVAAAGDLAVTTGSFRFTPPPGDPTAEASEGTYLSVWRPAPAPAGSASGDGDDAGEADVDGSTASGGWRLVADGTLLGARRRAVADAAETLDLDPAPPLRSRIETTTRPEHTAASGDLAYGIGTLTVRFERQPSGAAASAPHLAVWTGSDRTDPTWESVGSFRGDG